MVKTNMDKELVIHVRKASVGPVNLDNCHPFKVSSRQFVAMNGTLKMDIPSEYIYTDTQYFSETILKDLPVGWMKKQGIRTLLKRYIEKVRFLIIDKTGIYILNEDLGEWVDGVWWSNEFYKKNRNSNNLEEIV